MSTSAQNPPVTSFTSGEGVRISGTVDVQARQLLLGLGKGCPCIATCLAVSMASTRRCQWNTPSTLTGSCVPAEQACSRLRTTALLGLRSALSVPVLLLPPLSHPSHNGLCSSPSLPVLACVRRPCTCYSLFLKCSPRHSWHPTLLYGCL